MQRETSITFVHMRDWLSCWQTSCGRSTVRAALRRVSFVPRSGRIRKALLEIRVEGTDVLRVRRALMMLAGSGIDIIRVSPIPGSTRVSLSVAMRREALAAVMNAITNLVPNGEFGRMVPA
jgi:hypothetical protein